MRHHSRMGCSYRQILILYLTVRVATMPSSPSPFFSHLPPLAPNPLAISPLSLLFSRPNLPEEKSDLHRLVVDEMKKKGTGKGEGRWSCCLLLRRGRRGVAGQLNGRRRRDCCQRKLDLVKGVSLE